MTALLRMRAGTLSGRVVGGVRSGHAGLVPLSKQLLSAAGSWHGTNAFRLMPTDEPSVAPATATVTTEPGDAISLRYVWVHATDGEQRGLLVLADAGEGRVATLWIDTWHQPTARVVESDARPDGTVWFEYVYGDVWRWQVEVQAEPGLRITMRNVVPDMGEGPVDPYETMVMSLQRD